MVTIVQLRILVWLREVRAACCSPVRFHPLCSLSLLLILFGAAFSSCVSSRPSTALGRAEALRSAGKYREAIAEYRSHIDQRVKEQRAPDAPNPYFFALLIGDLYLQLEEPDQARMSYIEAKDHDAPHALVAHKIRYLGHWYEDHNQNDTAMQVYTEFHDLDPQLFEMDQDRLYKAMLAVGAGGTHPAPVPGTSSPGASPGDR